MGVREGISALLVQSDALGGVRNRGEGGLISTPICVFPFTDFPRSIGALCCGGGAQGGYGIPTGQWGGVSEECITSGGGGDVGVFMA